MRSEELGCLLRARFLIIFSVTGESSNPGHRCRLARGAGAPRRRPAGGAGLPLRRHAGRTAPAALLPPLAGTRTLSIIHTLTLLNTHTRLTHMDFFFSPPFSPGLYLGHAMPLTKISDLFCIVFKGVAAAKRGGGRKWIISVIKGGRNSVTTTVGDMPPYLGLSLSTQEIHRTGNTQKL